VIASGHASGFDTGSLAHLMVGDGTEGSRHVATSAVEESRGATVCEVGGEPVLELADVSARDRRGVGVLDGVTLAVRPGEIVAVAGVEGNGQAELVAVAAGIGRDVLREVRGRVTLGGREIASAAEARAAGLAVVPSDRTRDGMVAELPAWENLLLSRDRLDAVAARGVIPRAPTLASAREAMRAWRVQPSDPLRPAGSLSGGNQQRLMLARELGRERPLAVVAANPSRGLDLAATAAVRGRLRELAARGAAVLVLSTDLDEVLDLGHRVAVLYRGRLLEPQRRRADRATLGRLMAGGAEAA
jgi:simple sugar transport system ATP-binding protein